MDHEVDQLRLIKVLKETKNIFQDIIISIKNMNGQGNDDKCEILSIRLRELESVFVGECPDAPVMQQIKIQIKLLLKRIENFDYKEKIILQRLESFVRMISSKINIEEIRLRRFKKAIMYQKENELL